MENQDAILWHSSCRNAHPCVYKYNLKSQEAFLILTPASLYSTHTPALAESPLPAPPSSRIRAIASRMSLPAHNTEFVPLMGCLQDGPQALAVLWDVAQLISMKSPAWACSRPQEMGCASTWSLSSGWCNSPKQAWLLQWDSHTHCPEIL